MSGFAVTGDLSDLRVLEDPGIELGCFFGLVVEPQAGSDRLGEGHRTSPGLYMWAERGRKSLCQDSGTFSEVGAGYVLFDKAPRSMPGRIGRPALWVLNPRAIQLVRRPVQP